MEDIERRSLLIATYRIAVLPLASHAKYNSILKLATLSMIRLSSPLLTLTGRHANISVAWCTQLLAIAHEPRSCFFGSADGEMSNEKMSMGKPIVVHALGISTIPATCPSMGMQLSIR